MDGLNCNTMPGCPASVEYRVEAEELIGCRKEQRASAADRSGNPGVPGPIFEIVEKDTIGKEKIPIWP